MRAEGRGSSTEAFLRGRACGSSSFQSPWLSTCKSNQLCMSMCHLNHLTTNLEALNEATKMFQEHLFLGLGTILASNPKSMSGHTTFAEAPRKVRGRSAEARKSTLDPYPCLCFRNPFFSPMGNPNELLLVRPHVAATSQLHSYGNDSLSLRPRVASKSQLDLHENLCMDVTAFLKTCHPSAGIFCMCTHNII